MQVMHSELTHKISKAKSLLIIDHPFFGTAVSKLPIIITDNVPTAAMAPNGQMYINPDFAEPLSVSEMQFLLAHEALHYMLCHATRRKHRDPHAWNIAADKVINDTLVDAKVGTPIQGGIYEADARNCAAEELYDENDIGKPVGGIGSDVGEAVGEDGQALDDSKIREIESEAKISAVQSAKAAKSVGKLPSSLERLIDELVNVSTPWYQILERFMQSKVKNDISWRRPNRRFIGRNIYLPGADYTPTMGTVVIGVDTSGSIGNDELAMFGGHINRILETCTPERVVVVFCHAHVCRVDDYTSEDFPISLETTETGGTAFKPVFDYIDDNDIDPEVVVYLTDGYGDQSEFTSTHETIWLTTHSEAFDWGTVIKYEGE
jgi:predicted metal-dependent peptidase